MSTRGDQTGDSLLLLALEKESAISQLALTNAPVLRMGDCPPLSESAEVMSEHAVNNEDKEEEEEEGQDEAECPEEDSNGDKSAAAAVRPFSSNTSGDVPSLTDFEGGGGLMEENPESDDSPETRESSQDEASASSTLRNSYQVKSIVNKKIRSPYF